MESYPPITHRESLAGGGGWPGWGAAGALEPQSVDQVQRRSYPAPRRDSSPHIGWPVAGFHDVGRRLDRFALRPGARLANDETRFKRRAQGQRQRRDRQFATQSASRAADRVGNRVVDGVVNRGGFDDSQFRANDKG